MRLTPPHTHTHNPQANPHPGRTREQLLWVFEHRLKDAHEGLRQVVVQVVLAVDGQVVLQRVDGVLRLD